jgi:hypothetical protein
MVPAAGIFSWLAVTCKTCGRADEWGDPSQVALMSSNLQAIDVVPAER